VLAVGDLGGKPAIVASDICVESGHDCVIVPQEPGICCRRVEQGPLCPGEELDRILRLCI